MSLRIAVVVAVLALPLMPRTATAASVVPGFTEVSVGERGRLSVSLTLLGPAKGPLKAGLLKGRRISRARDLDLMDLEAGAFGNVVFELDVGRNPIGTHPIGIEGPHGIIAKTTITLLPGPRQETVVRAKSKIERTYLQKRDGDLRRAFVDDTDDALSVVFFLKLHEPGAAYTIDFIHKKARVCGDLVYPAGYPDQVVKVLAECKLGEVKDVVVEDDIEFDDYAPVSMSGAPSPGADEKKKKDEAKTMALAEIVKNTGRWKVEVRKGKKLKRVLFFRVKGGAVVAGAPGRAPLKIARVKVISP